MPNGRRILIAEDVPANAALFRAVLEGAGFAVDVAPDGEAAVAAGSAGGYAAILMDLGLPFLDGIEATRQLRAGGVGAPILALTADCDRRLEAVCLAAGMDRMLCKPLSPAALLVEIDAILAEPA